MDYKRKTRSEYKRYGWEWNCATARQATNERGGIGRQHVSDGCVTDAVSQCHSVRACPSANGHSSSFGILLPINKECRFDELLVRFRRWMGQSNKKGRRLDAYNSSTHAVIRVNLLIVAIKVNMVVWVKQKRPKPLCLLERMKKSYFLPFFVGFSGSAAGVSSLSGVG